VDRGVHEELILFSLGEARLYMSFIGSLSLLSVDVAVALVWRWLREEVGVVWMRDIDGFELGFGVQGDVLLAAAISFVRKH
jgi:hypothetical protein